MFLCHSVAQFLPKNCIYVTLLVKILPDLVFIFKVIFIFEVDFFYEVIFLFEVVFIVEVVLISDGQGEIISQLVLTHLKLAQYL